MDRLRTRSGAVMGSTVALVALAAVAGSSQTVQGRVESAVDALAAASPGWLAAAGGAFLLAFACSVGAWRAALAAAGGPICPRQAAARLGVGSLVNAVAPAKLGDAVKIALLSRAIDAPGGLWTTGGVYTALEATRALSLAALVVAASATGALPLWPVFALCGAVCTALAAAGLTARRHRGSRAARLFAGLATLAHDPRALSRVIAWTVALCGARLVGAISVTCALGLPQPVLAALVVLCALDLAGIVPITPGSVGVGSGAVAVALASRGIGGAQALGVGIAIQSVETAVSLAIGAAGSIYLLRPEPHFGRWALRIATAGASVGGAAAVGLVALNLT